MKLHNHMKNRKKVEKIFSLVLAACIVFSEGSQHIMAAEADSSENHQHNESCYEKVLICGMEEDNDSETDGHQHTDNCYERVLICGLKERRAEEEAADIDADVEAEYEWDEMFADVEWKNSWGEDLVTAARMQIGYRESEKNYVVTENKSRKGYTRYGHFAGDRYADWDAAFVNFCMYYAGLTEIGIFPNEIEAAEWYAAFAEADEKNLDYLVAPEAYVPAVGDIIFFEKAVEIEEAPAETEEPVETEEPAEAEESVETEEPAEAEESVETEEPAETEEPVETETPAETEESVETETPAEAEEPVETEAPAETEEPEDSEIETYAAEESVESEESDETSVADGETELVELAEIVEGAETEIKMGIVSSCNAEENTITVIEGDSAGEVRENTYDLADSEIFAYLKLTELEDYIKIHTRVLRVDGEDYTVIVRFSDEAGIPDDAVLDVREIEEGTDEYQMYYDQTLEAMETELLDFARYFDITFLVDGKEIEPAPEASVKVRIIYSNPIEVEEDSTVGVVHFAKDGTVEVLDAETNVSDNVMSAEGQAAEISLAENDEDGAVPDSMEDAELSSDEDVEGYFFQFEQNSFSVTGTVSYVNSFTEGWYTGYKIRIERLSDLDGKTFFITNISEGSSAMRGEVQDSTDIGKVSLKGEAFDNKPDSDPLSGDAKNVWKFEHVPGGGNSQFYVYNVGTKKYLKIGDEYKKGERAKISLVDSKDAVEIELDDDGTITISKQIGNYRYYINQRSGGNNAVDKRGFTGWERNAGGSFEYNKLTLFTTAQQGWYTGYEVKIRNLSDLDGKTFFLTNIATGSSVVRGEVQNSTHAVEQYCLKGEAFETVNGESGSYPLSGDANNVWRFEHDPDGNAYQFFVYNVGTGKYLKIGAEITAGERARLLLVDANDKDHVKIEINDDGTIAISRQRSNARYYLNQRSNGGGNAAGADKRGFTAWAKGYDKDYVGNKLTLFAAAQHYIVLNPYNIRDDGLNSTYRFNVDGEDSGYGEETKKIAIAVNDGASGTTRIKLPNDTERKGNFTVYGETHYINDSSNPDAYKWKLKGWYNIVTGQYISEENGWMADVNLSQDNIFYADWVAASYNNGTSENISGEVGGVKRTQSKEEASFITTKLFDYNELVNITLAQEGIGGASLTRNSPFSERWIPVENISCHDAVTNQEITSGFTFLDSAYAYIVKADNDGNLEYISGITTGSLGYVYGGGRAQAKISDNASNTESGLLPILFGESGNYMGVSYMGEANGLYAFGEYENVPDTYYYESQKYAASYNQSSNSFVVYNDPQLIDRESTSIRYNSNSFLPFNGEGTGYTHLDGKVNYWFGMKTEIEYWLNDDSGSEGANYNKGFPMKFNFSGDDDVWVFDRYLNPETESWEEEQLVLNLSGIHGELQGWINFSTGQVYYEEQTKDGDGNEIQHPYYYPDPSSGSIYSDRFKAGQHKLTIYYMERGGGLSNCKITFNLVPSWKFEGDPVQAITVKKEWKDANGDPYTGELKDFSVTVGLYEKPKNGGEIAEDAKPLDTMTLNAKNGWTDTWKYLDKDKEYVVREIEYAVGDMSFTASVSEPENVTERRNYWRETSTFADGEEIVLGNGLKGGNGKILDILAVDGFEEIISAPVDASDVGHVLKDDTRDISGTQKWIVHIVLSPDKHRQFRLENVGKPGWYLNIEDTSGPKLVKVEDEETSTASTFYFSEDGNLTSTSGKYLAVDESADEVVDENADLGFSVVSETDTSDVLVNGVSQRRIHTYKYDTTPKSKQIAYTITNKAVIDTDPQIWIQKVSQSSSDLPLKGAEFKLYDADSFNEEEGIPKEGAAPTKDSLISRDDGKIKLGALSAGIYYLVETKAPAGYVLLADPIKITVKDASAVPDKEEGSEDEEESSEDKEESSEDEEESSEDKEVSPTDKVEVEFHIDNWTEEDYVTFDGNSGIILIKVPNTVFYELPSTGGRGIYWYMISGTLLLMAGVLILYKKKVRGGAERVRRR